MLYLSNIIFKYYHYYFCNNCVYVSCEATRKRKYRVSKIYNKHGIKECYDQNYYFRCFCMSPDILKCSFPGLNPKLRRWLKSVGQRLCFLFWYLVTSDAVAASYRMSPAIVGWIVKETGAVIWNKGKDMWVLHHWNKHEKKFW